MTIHDQMFLASSQSVLENQHGETIALFDGTKELNPTAIVTADVLQRRQEPTGLVIAYARKATMTAATIDSLSGAKPSVGMTAKIGGQTYSVENVTSDGNSMTISLVRYQIRERSSPNYRG